MRDYIATAALFAVLYGVITYLVTGGDLRLWLPVIPFAFATHIVAAMTGTILKPPQPRRKPRSN